MRELEKNISRNILRWPINLVFGGHRKYRQSPENFASIGTVDIVVLIANVDLFMKRSKLVSSTEDAQDMIVLTGMSHRQENSLF